MQPGDHVDTVGEDGRHDEGVAGRGADVGHLDVELFVVVVEPAAGDEAGVDAVETDDPVCGEEGVEDEADHASDAVLSEHVHTVVDADQELDYELLADYFCKMGKLTLGCKIGNNASHNTQNDRSPRSDKSRSGSGSHQTRNTS